MYVEIRKCQRFYKLLSFFERSNSKSSQICKFKNFIAQTLNVILSQLKDYLGGTSKDATKEEFVTFIKKATDKKTPEYRQLYFFLLKCFQEGDVRKVN